MLHWKRPLLGPLSIWWVIEAIYKWWKGKEKRPEKSLCQYHRAHYITYVDCLGNEPAIPQRENADLPDLWHSLVFPIESSPYVGYSATLDNNGIEALLLKFVEQHSHHNICMYIYIYI
jgi:hypothetical protein